MANLFNKVFLFIQGNAVMFVQVYAYHFIGKRVMHIKKWEVRRNYYSIITLARKCFNAKKCGFRYLIETERERERERERD